MLSNTVTTTQFKCLRDVTKYALDQTVSKSDATILMVDLLLNNADLRDRFVKNIVFLAAESDIHLAIQIERKQSLVHVPELKPPQNNGLQGFDVTKSFPMSAIKHHGFLDYPLFDHTLLGDANYAKVLKQRNIFKANRIGNQRSENVFNKILKILKSTPKKATRDCLSFVDLVKLHKEFHPA